MTVALAQVVSQTTHLVLFSAEPRVDGLRNLDAIRNVLRPPLVALDQTQQLTINTHSAQGIIKSGTLAVDISVPTVLTLRSKIWKLVVLAGWYSPISPSSFRQLKNLWEKFFGTLARCVHSLHIDDQFFRVCSLHLSCLIIPVVCLGLIS